MTYPRPVPLEPPRIYIAGPYSSNPDENVRVAIACADILLGLGAIPFVPHLFHYWESQHPRHYEEWIALGLAWLRQCDALYRLPGASPGSDREVVHAMRNGVSVFFDFDRMIARLGLRSPVDTTPTWRTSR